MDWAFYSQNIAWNQNCDPNTWNWISGSIPRQQEFAKEAAGWQD